MTFLGNTTRWEEWSRYILDKKRWTKVKSGFSKDIFSILLLYFSLHSSSLYFPTRLGICILSKNYERKSGEDNTEIKTTRDINTKDNSSIKRVNDTRKRREDVDKRVDIDKEVDNAGIGETNINKRADIDIAIDTNKGVNNSSIREADIDGADNVSIKSAD